MKRGRDHDDSPEGIRRRANDATVTFRTELNMIAQEVGPIMALATLIGCASHFAREHVSRDTFVAMVIDMLHDVMHQKPGRK